MEAALRELYAEGAPDDEVAVIIRLSDPAAIPDGARIVTRFGRIATCRVRRGEIPQVWAQGSIDSMKAARLYGPTLEPMDALGAEEGLIDLQTGPTDLRRPEGELPDGKGVVVAHIDWGMDFAHPDFRKPDGSTRLLALWDQAAADDPERPNRYGYGRIHSAADIDRALAAPDPYAALGYHPAASDPLGFGSHGTHVISISAGNGGGGGPVGLAPAADLVFVHLSTSTAEGPTLLGDSVAFLEALDFIAKVAGARPCVVNASLGRQCGEHDGLTLTEQGMDAFLRTADGRAICMSTGNYFDRQMHARGLLYPGDSRSLRFVIEDGDPGPHEIDLWYPGADRFGLTLRAPGGSPEVKGPTSGVVPFVVEGRTVGRLYHRLGDPNNGDNEVTLFLYPGAPRGMWELIVDGIDVADGRYHAWIERSGGRRHPHFVTEDGDPTCTTGTICNGLWTMAVGAYDGHRPDRPLAHFSSSGPTRSGLGKPNLVAPGVRVLAARSRPVGDAPDPPLVTRMCGTSMADPHVTGTVALIFQAAGRPLPVAETRRLLLSSADRPPEDTSAGDRLRLGSGYLNAAAAVAAARGGEGVLLAAAEGPKGAEALMEAADPGMNAAPAELAPGVGGLAEAAAQLAAESDVNIVFDVESAADAAPTMAAIFSGGERGAEGSLERENAAADFVGEVAAAEITEAGDMVEAVSPQGTGGRDHGRQSAAAPGGPHRPPRAGPPLRGQFPPAGGAPGLASPFGGRASPLAVSLPLAGTSASPPPAPAPQPGPTAATSTLSPGSPMAATLEPPSAATLEPPAAAPVAAPDASALAGADQPVTVAPDVSLYVPPGSGEGVGIEALNVESPIGERVLEAAAAPGGPYPPPRAGPPLRGQFPLARGAPGLASPFGGRASPLAVSLPLGGTSAAPPPAPGPQPGPTAATSTLPPGSPMAATLEPPSAATLEPPAATPAAPVAAPDASAPAGADQPVTVAPDVSLYVPPGSAEGVGIEALDVESPIGERVLEAAEVVIGAGEASEPPSSAALLRDLVQRGLGVEEPVALSPLGPGHAGPSATALFKALVYPRGGRRRRDALHRHYLNRFSILAHPGEPCPAIVPQPGDLLIRVARGERWATVAVVASPGLHRHDRLAALGLRGEGYPRLEPGLYLHLVELGRRPRPASARFARRVADGAGAVLGDTLLLRLKAVRPSEGWAEAEAVPGLPAGFDHPLIGFGSRGTAVLEAQQKLNRVNANQFAAGAPGIAAAPLIEDGIFGALTRKATVSFQQLAFPDSRREWDGAIGPMTWPQLDHFAEAPLPTPPLPSPPIPPALNPPRWGPVLSASMSGRAALRAGNAVQFLIDGPATFRSMVEAMRAAQGAQHYIYLLGWKLVDDFQLIPGDPSTTARRLMGDAAARGVQIRAILWAKPPLENLAEVARVNALPTGGAIRDNETPHPSIGAHHQKLLVVKGSLGLIGFCGELDINSDRITVVHASGGEPLHDVHCRIAGPAAFDALQTFIRRWDHHPDHVGIDASRGALLGRAEPAPSPIATPAPGTSSTGATCSVAIARTFNPVTPGGALLRERDVRLLLLQAIRNAQRFIYMEDQYLIDLEAAAALRAAMSRLQHLTILIAASELSDLPCVWKFRRDFVAALTSGLSATDRAKVRIFDRITPPAARPSFGWHTYVHAKTWMFDDELAVIGSANCDRRGWEHDSEVNAFVFDDAVPGVGALTFAQAMRMALWSEHLSVPASAVIDGVMGAALWLAPPPGAAVRPYNPTGGRDITPERLCDATRDTIDPGMP